MEIAFDTTESEIEKQQLKFTLEAEKTITECIGILYRENGVSTAIIEVLRKLGNFLSAKKRTSPKSSPSPRKPTGLKKPTRHKPCYGNSTG